MKYLRNFKIFENLESKIDLQELESILIDFKQMGLEPDIKTGSSIVIDFDKLNKELESGESSFRNAEKAPLIDSKDIDNYTKGRSSDSLSIEFNSREPEDYNISESSEAYEMIKSYLKDTYDLIPNYIYINYHWNYMYFENFDKIKEYKNMAVDLGRLLGSDNENTFKAHKLVFGFYLP
jgi:hypothetical protein